MLVSGSFNHRSSRREYCHLIAVDAKNKKVPVIHHSSHLRQVTCQPPEVYLRRVIRRDLNGVPPAKGRGPGGALPIQKHIVAFDAALAIGHAFNLELLEVILPDIYKSYLPPGQVIARQDLNRVGALDVGHHTCCRVQHAQYIATLERFPWRDCQVVAVTRGLFGDYWHLLAARADSGTVNPWDARLEAGVVEEKTCLEVVRGIHRQVTSMQYLFDVYGSNVGYRGFDLNLRVYRFEDGLGRHRLRQSLPRVLFVEQCLPLKVVELHKSRSTIFRWPTPALDSLSAITVPRAPH